MELLLVILLVVTNGFFVAAEFAMVRTRMTRLKSPEMARKLGVRSALRLMSDLDGSLSSTQLGITIASLILGWWGEETFHHIFSQIFSALGEPFAGAFSHTLAIALALTIVTFLHVVVGELVAKSLGIRYPELTLRIVAGPTVIFSIIFRPIILFLASCASLFLRLFGITTAAESERAHSSAELAMLVSQSTEKGILDKDEEEMLHGVFTFSDTVAREVMTPRTDLVTVPAAANFDEIVATMTQARFSRYPVVGDSVDNVLGILMIRDLLPHVWRQKLGPGMSFDVRKVMREPYFVPGTKKIDDLLNEFKKRKVHLAIVVDEHGGVDGVVTLEDLLEEIVGDIFDEADVPEKDIVVQDDGNIIVDGGVLVSDLNSRFEVSIPEGDYDTIAGFIYTSLGRMPRPGDQIAIEGGGATLINGKRRVVNGKPAEAVPATEGEDEVDEEAPAPKSVITVEHVKGRRIERVRVEPKNSTISAETAPIPPASQPKG